jgi:ribosomal protein S18 acetylase RimI-like enzyme
MNESVALRPAVLSDAPFLTKAILAAEELPLPDANITMYERIFMMERDEVAQMIRDAVLQDGRGHQLTWRTFNVLEVEDRAVATCAAWIESAFGPPSGVSVAMIVSRFLGQRRWRTCTSLVKQLSAAVPRRTPGSIQLESFFVAHDVRGSGFVSRLIDGALERLAESSARVSQAEIILLRENARAKRAYERAGFFVADESPDASPEFQTLTGSKGFVLLRRSLA